METIKNTFSAWVSCISVSLFFFYEFLQATMLDSISNNLLQSLQCNAIDLANISASYFYANVLFLIPAGLILDKISVRKVVGFFILLSIVGVFLLSVSETVRAAKYARFISGISGAFCFLSCLKVVSYRFSFNKFPFVVGVLITIAFLGGIVSHVPFAILTREFGWRNAVKSFGILGCIIFILNLVVLGQDKYLKLIPNKIPKSKQIILDLKTVITNKYTWTGAIYTALLNLPVILLGALWSTLYLIEVNRLTLLEAATVTSALFIGLIIGSPLIALFSKNVNSIKNNMITGAFLSFFVMLMLIFYEGASIHILFALFFLLGFFSSAQSLGYSFVMLNVPASVTSLASSIISIIVLGGGAMLKILFGMILEWGWDGRILDKIHVYSKMDFDLALAILPISFLICAILPILATKNPTSFYPEKSPPIF